MALSVQDKKGTSSTPTAPSSDNELLKKVEYFDCICSTNFVSLFADITQVSFFPTVY